MKVCFGHGSTGVVDTDQAGNHFTIVSGRVAPYQGHGADVLRTPIIKSQAQGQRNVDGTDPSLPRGVVVIGRVGCWLNVLDLLNRCRLGRLRRT